MQGMMIAPAGRHGLLEHLPPKQVLHPVLEFRGLGCPSLGLLETQRVADWQPCSSQADTYGVPDTTDFDWG